DSSVKDRLSEAIGKKTWNEGLLDLLEVRERNVGLQEQLEKAELIILEQETIIQFLKSHAEEDTLSELARFTIESHGGSSPRLPLGGIV
ncbi:MAG: hypothetical protein KKC55_17175, partial [Gammaproteobacteria bacterium]|nr:hypothetical protein [Gammaproteobacteria bacterium]